jgi:hypothetical protein
LRSRSADRPFDIRRRLTMNTNPERIDFNRRHLLSGAAGTAVAAPFAMLTSANAQSAPKLPDIKPRTHTWFVIDVAKI